VQSLWGLEGIVMCGLRRVVWLVLVHLVISGGWCQLVRGQQRLQRISFGSCAKQDQPQPIWDAIVAGAPDLFILLGDNIYGDTNDMRVLREKYGMLERQPGFVKLRATCPVLATWDDHDYGRDDAGAEFEQRAESQRVFLDFGGSASAGDSAGLSVFSQSFEKGICSAGARGWLSGAICAERGLGCNCAG